MILYLPRRRRRPPIWRRRSCCGWPSALRLRSRSPRSLSSAPSPTATGRSRLVIAAECAGAGCARDGRGRGPAARPGAQARPQQPADRRPRPLQRDPRLHDHALGRRHAGADPGRQAQCPRAPRRARGRTGPGDSPGHHRGPAARHRAGLARTLVPGVDARTAAVADRPGRTAGPGRARRCTAAARARRRRSSRRADRSSNCATGWRRPSARSRWRPPSSVAGSVKARGLPLAPRPALTLPAWTEGALAEHLTQHPQIAAAAQQEAIADSEAAVARAARSSDWSVELQYSQRGPAYSNMVSINLSVPLQWDQKNRQDRELAARLAGIDEARARREELQRAHEAEVRAMLQEWRSHEERLRRYDASLLPLATQRSEAALASYRAGSGPLTGRARCPPQRGRCAHGAPAHRDGPRPHLGPTELPAAVARRRPRQAGGGSMNTRHHR